MKDLTKYHYEITKKAGILTIDMRNLILKFVEETGFYPELNITRITKIGGKTEDVLIEIGEFK